MSNKYLIINNDNGEAPILIPASQDSAGNFNLSRVNGLNLGAASEQKLASVLGVNMNTATPTPLYAVPAGKTCVITKIVLKNASTSLTTASISFGFTSAAFNDVIATATHTELTGATLYTILVPKVGAILGVAAAVLNVLCNILQGGAATLDIDVYGYLF